MSHGWARTVDGAREAHGNRPTSSRPNLDRLTAYVAQSRGWRPTHTWNTTRELSGEEHGNVVVDPRDPPNRSSPPWPDCPSCALRPPMTPGPRPASPRRARRTRSRAGRRTARRLRDPRPFHPQGRTRRTTSPTRVSSFGPTGRLCCAPRGRWPSTSGGPRPTGGDTPRSTESTASSSRTGPTASSSPSIRTTLWPTVSTACGQPEPTSPPVPARTPIRWLSAVDRAVAARRSIEKQRGRELDHDLGISL